MLICTADDCFGPAAPGSKLCRACEADKRVEAAMDRIEERVTTLLTENLALKAEVADLKRVNAALQRRAWGWSAGVVPLAEPHCCGVFFHVKPADVERFVRERFDAYNGAVLPNTAGFGYSVGDRGSLMVRLLDDGGWRTQRGV